MGRKRNQGKARRAAKAKAKEEAERRESNNKVITDGPGQSLTATQMRLLQIGEKCSHGFDYDSTNDFCFESLRAFNSSFEDVKNGGEVVRSGDRSLSDCLLHAKNATMDQFADFWSDSTKMEMAISILLYTGTVALIESEDHIIARDAATFARFLEQHIALMLKQSQANIDWPKIQDTYQADLHTLVSFFRRRIPCSCLDEKYQEVKHITKMGHCYNSECKFFLGSEGVERWKTKYCSRCRCATYCSRECHEANWSRHKPDCDEFAAMISMFEAKQHNM